MNKCVWGGMSNADGSEMAKETRMFRTGLLVLTKPLAMIQQGIPSVLKMASERVLNNLYVHLVPRAPEKPCNLQSSSLVNPFLTIPANPTIRNLVIELYHTSAKVCQHLDVRVLLSHMTGTVRATSNQLNRQPYSFRTRCEVVLIDECCDNESVILQELSKVFNIDKGAGVLTISSDSKSEIETESESETETGGTLTSEQPLMVNGADTYLEAYQHGVMGGTFDRLHVGHKILLSDACLRCSESVTVGVTDRQMNKKKTLCELIRPIEERINDVKTFMEEVKPRLSYTVVPISDPFGPSTQDPQLQCIVVSQETLRGGHKVNEERAKKGLSHLDIHVIDLIEDQHHSSDEEVKISSSSSRKRLLGTLIKDPEPRPSIPSKPYRIGLAGGIASGKSSVCKRLQKLGAGIIDCDRLGHQVYRKGTDCFQKIIAEFGPEIIGEDGEIYRTALGSIVFSDKGKMAKLNEIVWPEIARLVEEEIQVLASTGKSVVVLDAAVLLEAGWDKMVHEVWTALIPTAEAVKRLQDRNNLSEEEALKRIGSQMTPEERVERSNVILSTLWEYEVTQKQVEKAWKLLNERLSFDKSQL